MAPFTFVVADADTPAHRESRSANEVNDLKNGRREAPAVQPWVIQRYAFTCLQPLGPFGA